MKAHPICELLPAMSNADYIRLKDDIQKHGILRPIVVHEGMILDGRHRYKACQELKVTPKTETYSGDDPAGYVFSVNIAHRHLSKSQLAIAAARLKNYFSQKAKERQGARTDIPVIKTECSFGDARDQAGKALGVSGSTVDKAEKVLANCIPEIISKVEGGDISISQGNDIAKLDSKRQLQISKLPDKKSIGKAIKKATSKNRNQVYKSAFGNAIPGTLVVKEVLMRLETFADAIEKSGLDPVVYGQRFLNEFDDNDPILNKRMLRATDALRCVSYVFTNLLDLHQPRDVFDRMESLIKRLEEKKWDAQQRVDAADMCKAAAQYLGALSLRFEEDVQK